MFGGSYYGVPLIIGASFVALIAVVGIIILTCVFFKKKKHEAPVLDHVNHNNYNNYSSYAQNPTLALPISSPPVVNIV